MSQARCGTASGWSRHKNAGEKPCPPCVEAKREYDKRWRAAGDNTKKNRLHAKAQARAYGRLARIYPEVYHALYDEERIALYREHGLPIKALGTGNGTTERIKKGDLA